MIREKARYSNLRFSEFFERRPFGVAKLLPLRTLISRQLHFRRTWLAQTQRNLRLSVLQRRRLERIKGADFGVFDTEFPQKNARDVGFSQKIHETFGVLEITHAQARIRLRFPRRSKWIRF